MCLLTQIIDFPSEADIRAELRRDEAALGAAGQTPLHGSSATVFLSTGIQIEDSQLVHYSHYMG
jgi:hypothetical protein